MPTPPDGFKPFQISGGFFDHIGPVFYKKCADDVYLYGMRVDDRHTNPGGVAHGGLLYAFTDQFMGRAVSATSRRYCTTIKMAAEYLAPARPGDWLEGRTTIMSVTRTLTFIRADVSANGNLVMTAEGVWKLLKPY